MILALSSGQQFWFTAMVRKLLRICDEERLD